MSWQFSPFFFPLVLAGALCAVLAAYALRHREVPAAREFALLTVASAWWAFAYALYRASTGLDAKFALALAIQAGAIVVAPAWAMFALRYTGRHRWLRPLPLAALWAVPVLTLALALTNRLHGWFWSRFELVERAGRVAIDSANAWGFWLHVWYSWALMSATVALLLLAVLRAPHLYRSQAGTLVAAALVPWIGNVLHVSGFVRFGANPMPLLFGFSAAAFAWAIFRYRFLDVLPVAREAVVEAMRDAVVVLDERGRVLDVNAAACRRLGLPEEGVVGRSADVLPAPVAALVGGCADAAAEGEATEIRLDGPDGPLHLDVRVTPLREARSGASTGCVLVLRDLTERLRTGEARAYLEQLFDSATEGIVLLDAEERVIRSNAEFRRIFGWQEEELAGRVLNDVIVPETLRPEGEAFTARIEAGERIEGETLRRRADGSLVDVAVSGVAVTVGGERVATFGIYRDISIRKRLERERAALLAREREARAAAEAAERRSSFLADAGTVLSDAFGSEQTYERLARLTVPEIADYCLLDEVEEEGGTRRVARAHVDPEREARLLADERNLPDADPERHPVVRVVRTGEPLLVERFTPEVMERLSYDERHRARFAESGMRSFMIVPLTARGRTLGAMTLAATEASGRTYGPADLEMAVELARRAALALDNARLYARAQRAIRERENVLGVVGHDMRNPLAGILLNATSILGTEAAQRLGTWEREQLRWIVQSVEQMDRLIEDLLDVSRIGAGRFTVSPAPHAAGELVRDALLMLGPLAEQRGVALDARIDGDGPSVRADHPRVMQVFSNLVGNALKFTPRDGRVVLSAEEDGGRVRFLVRDTGCGIPREHFAHLFERFWQGGGGNGRRGSGLGLAIVSGIVEAHGGEVGVESEVGRGSCFHFTLPLWDAAKEGAEA